MSFCSPMALRKSIARNSTTGISSGLIQTIEFDEDFVDAIEGVSISNDMSHVTWRAQQSRNTIFHNHNFLQWIEIGTVLSPQYFLGWACLNILVVV